MVILDIENRLEFVPPDLAARAHYYRIPSPLGELRLVSDGRALRSLHLEGAAHVPPLPTGAKEDRSGFLQVIEQLEEYFAGKRRGFALTVSPRGTPFQLEVWHALAAIPYGTTASYATIATVVGRPRAVRAIGAANGHNPISVIVPCHRVIGANGSLTGYAGGLERKELLLGLEWQNRDAVPGEGRSPGREER